ncbi:MAG: hypothetical protein EHM58_09045 [Ignavibacteriae bacterium]|nr:MAG: hypothetical protein EHM58_09045 [Ignavibacteriota bacterium]
MKLYKSLLRTVIALGVLFVPFYFIACDVGESVAVKSSCESSNTAELIILNNSSTVYNVYVDGVYKYAIQQSLSKTETVSADVDHVIKFYAPADPVNPKCIATKKLAKCTSGTVTCSTQ